MEQNEQMEQKEQKEQKDNSHKAWAQGRKASMKRRCEEYNYTEQGLYMVTLAIEGRKPLLGQLKGKPEVTTGNEAPHVELSPWGERVKKEWMGIPHFYPQIKPIKLCIMPDHIHGILYVQEKIEKHLGHVICGFKAGTRKAARELGLLAAVPETGGNAALKAQPTEQKQPTETVRGGGNAALKAQPTEQKQPTETVRGGGNAALKAQPTEQKQPTETVQYAALSAQLSPSLSAQQPTSRPAQKPSRHTAAGRAHGTLWEPGYNDRILLKKGQLQHWLDYLDDNPRRLLLKRQHPEYFTQLGTLQVAGVEMQAMGNPFLLERPMKLQVQCSRHLYPNEIAQQQQAFLQAGAEGSVIVSPCISPGEQQIATACMAAGVPLIVLLLKGFPRYFKPQPRYFEACAQGRLLMLSPYPWQNEKMTDMRARCLHLNELAKDICEIQKEVNTY